MRIGATDTLTLELQLLNTRRDYSAIARRAANLDSLGAARAFWALRKPIRYPLTVKVDCFCPLGGPATYPLEFINDSITSIDSRGRRFALRDQQYRDAHIDALFARIELSLRRFDMPNYRGQYDSSYGFTRVIDFVRRELHASHQFSVIYFRALPPPGFLVDVRRMNKVIDERDVPPLETCRYVLLTALLTVGVLSPSSRRTDPREKRDLYQRKGVPEYWIVDVDNRRVDRWRRDDTTPATLTATLEWQPGGGVCPLVIDLAAFDRIVGGTL